MTWKKNQPPSESDENSVGPIEDVNQDDVESVAAPVDPLVQLQADVNAAKEEVAEWQDRFLRKAAEFENYRKRTEKEKFDSMALAKSSVLVEFLPVLDACERASKASATRRKQVSACSNIRKEYSCSINNCSIR